MDDEYSAFAGGKLKLRKTGDGVVSASKKKKKRDKERRKLEALARAPKPALEGPEAPEELTEGSGEEKEEEELEERPHQGPERTQEHQRYTKAELAFKKQQEKMQNERIKNKAMKTHKQRVEAFNRHLDNLTEHFDIPKVSWTK